jgi:dTDP-glucose 4,6-dehydratase
MNEWHGGSSQRILITGGAGFIGHHVVEYFLKETDWQLTLIDRLDCSGNLNRLAEVGAAKNSRVRFVFHDLRGAINDQLASQLGSFDYITHLAAATHVDRSIESPLGFVLDNVVGTCNLLEFARHTGCGRFLYFSTDEVFGPAPEGLRYVEEARYKSGNPYAATKAGGEELSVAYHNTYKLPVLITHTMNVIGYRQHPEKFVPGTIAKVRDGEKVTIHADKTCTKAGSRFYIDAREVANAVKFLLKNGVIGEKYNIVGEQEVDNLELAQWIAEAQGEKLDYEMVDFHGSRPGHDLRYALDGEKMKKIFWFPRRKITQSIEDIVDWSLANPHWLTPRKTLRSVA